MLPASPLRKYVSAVRIQTWGSCYTNANDYITEWPVLGILIIALALLLIGIAGIFLSYLIPKYENSIHEFISDWFSVGNNQSGGNNGYKLWGHHSPEQ